MGHRLDFQDARRASDHPGVINFWFEKDKKGRMYVVMAAESNSALKTDLTRMACGTPGTFKCRLIAHHGAVIMAWYAMAMAIRHGGYMKK